MNERRGGVRAIADARAADLRGVLAVARAALPDPWSDAAYAEEIGREGGVFLVATAAEGEVLGYLIARAWTDELHVLSLAVAEGARRAGVGTALLDAALARRPDAAVAHLEVRPSNAAGRAFYERLGFEPLGLRPRYYADGESALLLVRRLGAARAARSAEGGR